jgi:hypothetical protein
MEIHLYSPHMTQFYLKHVCITTNMHNIHIGIIYIYIYIYTHTHTHTRTYTYTHIHTYPHIHTQIYTHTNTDTNAHIHTHIQKHTKHTKTHTNTHIHALRGRGMLAQQFARLLLCIILPKESSPYENGSRHEGGILRYGCNYFNCTLLVPLESNALLFTICNY